MNYEIGQKIQVMHPMSKRWRNTVIKDILKSSKGQDLLLVDDGTGWELINIDDKNIREVIKTISLRQILKTCEPGCFQEIGTGRKIKIKNNVIFIEHDEFCSSFCLDITFGIVEE